MARRTSDSTLKSYLRQIARYPLLGREEERELASRIAGGEHAARQRMVLCNLRLVVRVARDFTGRGLDLMDLVEEGNLGLLRAVEGFDPGRDVRFSTYATWWIRRAILRALNSCARTIRIPTYMIELIANAKRTQAELRTELDRDPTTDELARRLPLDEPHARLVERLLSSRTTSIYDNPTGDPASDVSLAAVLRDTGSRSPEEIVFGKIEIEALEQLLKTIDEREALVLSLRYGLDKEAPKSLREAGREIGLSRERVRQIEKHALHKLKEALEHAGFD